MSAGPRGPEQIFRFFADFVGTLFPVQQRLRCPRGRAGGGVCERLGATAACRCLAAKGRNVCEQMAPWRSALRASRRGCRGSRWAETRSILRITSGRRGSGSRGLSRRRLDTLRAPVTCCLGAGEWPAHDARSTHRKPARGQRPFRPVSDARGAGETVPCSSCRWEPRGQKRPRAARAKPPHKSAMRKKVSRGCVRARVRRVSASNRPVSAGSIPPAQAGPTLHTRSP